MEWEPINRISKEPSYGRSENQGPPRQTSVQPPSKAEEASATLPNSLPSGASQTAEAEAQQEALLCQVSLLVEATEQDP
jgi:hypothetical protein